MTIGQIFDDISVSDIRCMSNSALFSVPCGGYLVRDGQPVGSVSQMTVAGSLRELFTAVEAVADDLDFDDFYFRNYCIGSPSALLRGLRFST